MTTIYNGFSFTDPISYNTMICRSDNGSGLTYCDEIQIDDDGSEMEPEERRLTHGEIGHMIRDSVVWCDVTPDQWNAILAKVPADKIEDILGYDRSYSESNVGYILQDGDELFEGFDAWLLSELDIWNKYD